MAKPTPIKPQINIDTTLEPGFERMLRMQRYKRPSSQLLSFYPFHPAYPGALARTGNTGTKPANLTFQPEKEEMKR